MPDAVNFVFFMPDSLRAGALGCYGHPLIRTPNFDRIADEGTLFERCICQYPVCGPSRCSMITGLYPHNTGCRTNEYFLEYPQENLFTCLKRAGYHVEWHGKNDMFAPNLFPHAVSRCNQRPPEMADRPEYDVHEAERIAPIGEPGGRSFLCKALGTVEGFGDTHRVEAAIAWLESRGRGDKPFVLYLPLEMPHPPFTAPEPYYSMYDPADVPPLRPYELPGKPRRLQLLRQYHELDRMPDDMLRQISAVYLGMVSYSDWLLGRVLAALERLSLLDNTVIVALSDHGEFGGDYGLVCKASSALEDVLTHVPFLWRGSGIAAGHRADGPVELFDLMATALDLAGIECRHPNFARSLRPQLEGAPGDLRRAAYCEGGHSAVNKHCGAAHYMNGQLIRETDNFYHPSAACTRDHPEVAEPSTMIETHTHKLIYRPGSDCELYDLRADPQELHNLYDAPACAEIRRTLEKRLLNWLIETSDVTPNTTHPRQGPRESWD